MNDAHGCGPLRPVAQASRGVLSARMLRAARAVLAACVLLLPAHGLAQTALDTYREGLSTWSADFTQVTQDERGRNLDEAAGRLLIVTPCKFRWETSLAPGEPPVQLMIADGSNLWFLDHDLEQATVKPQDEAMRQSPAMLLACGAGLRDAFTVTADGRRDGHDWVKVQPQQAESDFREALFGYRGRELARLVVVDKWGQRTTLRFSNVRRNATVDPAQVRFTLPPGADLIGNPVEP